MASLKDYGDGRYRLRATVAHQSDGSPIVKSRSFEAPNLHEAQIMALRIEDELRQNPVPVPRGTFSGLLDRWLVAIRYDLSPTTYAQYVATVNRDGGIRERLGDRPLKDLTARDLEGFYGELRRAGAAANTIKNHHIVICSALSWAVRGREIPESPVKYLSKRLTPRAGEERSVGVTTQHVRALMEAARQDPEFFRLVSLAALTGCRRGELCGLRLTDEVDGVVHVQRSVYPIPYYVGLAGVGVKEPKSRRGRRHLPLDTLGLAVWDGQRAWLEKMAADAGVTLAPDAYLFPDLLWDASGRCPRRPGSLTERFDYIRRLAGLPEIRLHDLRHYLATTMVAHGVDVRTAAARLGHDPAMMLRVYTQVHSDKALEAARLMGSELADK